MGISIIAATLIGVGILGQNGGQEVPPGYSILSSFKPMIFSVPTLIETLSGNPVTITATIKDQDSASNSNGSMLYGCYHTEWIFGNVNTPETGLGTPNVQPDEDGKNVFTWAKTFHGHLDQEYVFEMTPRDWGGASTAHNSSSISDGSGSTQTLTVVIRGSGTTPVGGTGGGTPAGG